MISSNKSHDGGEYCGYGSTEEIYDTIYKSSDQTEYVKMFQGNV